MLMTEDFMAVDQDMAMGAIEAFRTVRSEQADPLEGVIVTGNDNVTSNQPYMFPDPDDDDWGGTARSRMPIPQYA
eukprot:SAG11_NODE_14739_length_601_cov_1.099602_2_plen_75_part_00